MDRRLKCQDVRRADTFGPVSVVLLRGGLFSLRSRAIKAAVTAQAQKITLGEMRGGRAGTRALLVFCCSAPTTAAVT